MRGTRLYVAYLFWPIFVEDGVIVGHRRVSGGGCVDDGVVEGVVQGYCVVVEGSHII